MIAPMQIQAPCVVSLSWRLEDAHGQLIDELTEPLEFLVGGDDLFPKVEEALAGVRVASVEPNSGAEEAGVREGDEIVAIDGHPVARFSDVRLALWERSAGEKSTVEILRRRWIGPDEPATLTVTLR